MQVLQDSIYPYVSKLLDRINDIQGAMKKVPACKSQFNWLYVENFLFYITPIYLYLGFLRSQNKVGQYLLCVPISLSLLCLVLSSGGMQEYRIVHLKIWF